MLIPYVIVKLSWSTLEIGARQLVVHDALDTTFKLGWYPSWLTPYTNNGV